MLEKGAVFIVPLVESLALPSDIGGKANPKSTTGRLDIFTRLITDGGLEFEYVPKGYTGELYVEIVSRTFPIVVQAGTKLSQLRFVRGNPPSGDGVLEQLAERERLVYYENDEGPVEAIVDRGLEKLVHPSAGGPEQAIIDRGLRTTIDLAGIGATGIVAYKAKSHCAPVDLSKVGAHAAADFWDAIEGPRSGGLVLDPGDFYLLASRERFCIPSGWAAEMEPFDQSIGEFSVHYAGFFDPGFGYGAAGEIKGTRAVPSHGERGADLGRGDCVSLGLLLLLPDGQCSGQALRPRHWLFLPEAGTGAKQTIQNDGERQAGGRANLEARRLDTPNAISPCADKSTESYRAGSRAILCGPCP